MINFHKRVIERWLSNMQSHSKCHFNKVIRNPCKKGKQS